jgi:hypothetical protein
MEYMKQSFRQSVPKQSFGTGKVSSEVFMEQGASEFQTSNDPILG